MTHRRVLASAAALAALPLLVTGCVPSGPRLVTLGEWYAVVAQNSEYGMDALVSGRVEIDDHMCFGLASDDGVVHPVLWPDGTYLDRGGLFIPGFDDIPENGIGAGTPITAGGGEVPAAESVAPCWDEGDLVWVIAPDSTEYGFPPD